MMLKRIAVVGSGAVGCYYGGMLARGGHDVHFLMRADLEAVRAQGLEIRTRGERHIFPVHAHARSSDIGPVDLVIVALKTTANDVLEQVIPPLLHANTALVTLQNGLGNEAFLGERWGYDRIMGALCFVCLNRIAPGIIEHFDHGSISIGEWKRPVSERVSHLVAAFQKEGIDAQAVPDLVAERWRKLLWNIPFNGLSIVARAHVAQVLASSHLRGIAEDLIAETLEAANKLGCAIPEAYARWQVERSYSMGNYRSSSMIDYEAGQPVEVEAIWGEPWRAGIAAGVRMDRLETIYHLIKFLAEENLKKVKN